MSYSVLDLKTDLFGMIHGTTLNDLPNITNLINRAARKVVSDIDIFECRRVAQITSPIYGEVYDYPLPTDLKANRIVDIRPIENSISRNGMTNFTNLFARDFMRAKESGTFNFKQNNGTKSLRLSASIGGALNVNSLNNITDNGTWALGGTGTDLEVDNLNFLTGGASLKFNTSVGTSAYIENSTMTPVDLSNLDNEGAMFLYVYLPTCNITNIELRWGSSASDYFATTVTAQQDGTVFQQGWNLLRFAWGTETGTVDNTAINYARITLTYPSQTLTSIRVNGLTAQLGKILEIEYYSKYLFRDSVTGAFKEKTDSDNDLINLDTDSYNIFLNVLGEYANQQIAGSEANYDISYFKNEYEADKKKYVSKYPSETIKPRATYWTAPTKRSSRRLLTS